MQLAGFFDYFDANRVQIIGNVEYSYTTKLMEEGEGKEIEVYEKLSKLFSKLEIIILQKSFVWLGKRH